MEAEQIDEGAMIQRTKGVRGRLKGHWANPISPLQAARFGKHETLEQAAAGISDVCPGHVRGGILRDCEMSGGLLNDYERGARRPSVDHLQALCDYYGKPAETLGLIKVTWADSGTGQPQAAAPDLPGSPGEPGPDRVEGSAEVPPADGAMQASDGTAGTIQTNHEYSKNHQASRSVALSGDSGEAAPFAELLAALLLEEGHGGEGSDEVERRLFLDRVIATVTSATALDPVVRVARHVRERLLVTKVSASEIDALDRAVHRHVRAFPGTKSGDYARNLSLDWAKAGRMLDLPQTPSQRVRMSAAYARLSGILGAFAYHAGNGQRALALLESGQHAAAEAGDSDLVGWLYGRQGLVLAFYGGDRRAVIELYGQGLKAASGNTTTSAWLHAAIARTHAELGNRDEALTALNAAERLLGQASAGCWVETDDEMPRGFLFTPDRLAFYTGETLIRLGEDGAAARTCTYATSLQDRLRVQDTIEKPLNRLNLALAALRQGNADEAFDIATDAISSYQGIADMLVDGRANAFGRALVKHSATRQASDFADFMRHVIPSRLTNGN